MDIPAVLFVLSLSGSVVGFTATMVATFRRTTDDVEGTDRKVVTAPGRWALTLGMIGLAVSVLSQSLKEFQDRQEAQLKSIDAAIMAIEAEHEKAATERNRQQDIAWKDRADTLQGLIKSDTTAALDNIERNLAQAVRTQLIAERGFLRTGLAIVKARQSVLAETAAQSKGLLERVIRTNSPIASATISFEFQHVPKDTVRSLVEDCRSVDQTIQHRVDNDILPEARMSPDESRDFAIRLKKARVVYPFLRDITGRPHSASVVFLVPLDESFVTFLPLGYCPEAPLGEKSLSAGIDIADNVADTRVNEATGDYVRPTADRVTTRSPYCEITARGSTVVVRWRLDPSTFWQVIEAIRPPSAWTATLPDVVNLVALTNIVELPYKTGERGNLEPQFADLLTGGEFSMTANLPAFARKFVLRLSPNGKKSIERAYNVRYMGEATLNRTTVEPLDGLAVPVPFVDASLWRGQVIANHGKPVDRGRAK